MATARRAPSQRALQQRFERGRRGEVAALKWLTRRGFRILATQVSQDAHFWVNGQPRTATVRADMLAERRGRIYVVEVKTGKVAPNPETRATRRQLLEYAHAFDTDGVLLADMESRKLMAIEFPSIRRRRASSRRWSTLAMGWLLGVLSVLATVLW